MRPQLLSPSSGRKPYLSCKLDQSEESHESSMIRYIWHSSDKFCMLTNFTDLLSGLAGRSLLMYRQPLAPDAARRCNERVFYYLAVRGDKFCMLTNFTDLYCSAAWPAAWAASRGYVAARPAMRRPTPPTEKIIKCLSIYL